MHCANSSARKSVGAGKCVHSRVSPLGYLAAVASIVRLKSGANRVEYGSSVSRNSRRKRRQAKRNDRARSEPGLHRQSRNASQILSTSSTESIFSLLDAASISPTSSHCGNRIGHLFNAVVKQPDDQNGEELAGHDSLPKLIRAADKANRSLVQGDDFKPYDGRNRVFIRWGTGLFRMIPGSLERPTALVRQQALIASAIDDTLIPQLGFGLRDVGELILRRIDAAARSVLAESPDVPQANVGDGPTITEPEVQAATELPTLACLAKACSDPARAEQALAHFIALPADLTFDPLMGQVSRFGPVMGVLRAGHEWALPTGFLPEALPAMGAELAALAASVDDDVHQKFAALVGARIRKKLLASGHPTMGPLIVGDNGSLLLLVRFNDSRALVLNLIAALTDEKIQQLCDAGAKVLAKIRPGTDLKTSNETIAFPADSEIVCLQVLARPESNAPMLLAGPYITLQDLEWILYTSLQDRDDLWFFARDLGRTHNKPLFFSFDVIDKWEVWRQEKGFYRGGKPIPAMVFAPHAAISEWEEASRSHQVEEALDALDLPELSEWPLVDLSDERTADVADPGERRAYYVAATPMPVAISRVASGEQHTSDEILWVLASAIAWKLKHIGDAIDSLASASNLKALRIEFEYANRASGSILTADPATNGVLTIRFDSRLDSALAADSGGVEAACGKAVAAAFADPSRDHFVTVWDSAPPGIRMDGLFIREHARNFPQPFRVHDAIRHDTMRSLGEFLASNNVPTGVRVNAEATNFESHTVFPWLINRFHEEISPLSARQLVEFGIRQLEAANHHRLMLEKRIGWERGFPVHGESDALEDREEISRLIRTIAFVVEEALAHPPSGNKDVREADWVDALSIGDLCIESCFRSDSIHQRLSSTSIKLTDLYEVQLGSGGDPSDVNLEEYKTQRAYSSLPDAIPITPGSEMPIEVDQTPMTILESKPELKPIDQMMRVHMGFGFEHIRCLLNTAIDWDTTDNEPIAYTDMSTIVDRCATHLATEDQTGIEPALAWLTISGAALSADVIPHWETERREKRLTTSPFVSMPDDLAVMPWAAETALRIFSAYIEDGRLPWSSSILPAEVIKALNKFRQVRNREVEKDCVQVITDLGLTVIGGLKPQKAGQYGISSLSGEIDALCLDASASRIWVIEAKDPYMPYSAYQIRRLVNDFEEPAKYVDKLLQKVKEIDASKDALAAVLDLQPASGEWLVSGLMVTRHLEPAAFVINPRTRYCLLSDLVDFLSRKSLPPLGFFASDRE